MPIYAYKCSACGHADDVLQKISAAPLTVCPACGQSTYSKQVTAPQFQLKGSGWYVTDFRGGTSTKDSAKDGTAKSDAKPAADVKTDTKAADAPAAACPVHAPAAPAPAATPAAKPATTE
ncbi:MAG: zinc ribbon domain-containing protein [Betaproteobacteria bacterium]|nr:zinc ribbon domain-containing protein [Betaproteobacteria bacterium]